MKSRFTLKKKERLKSRKQIEKLFQEGRSIAVASFRVLYSVQAAEYPSLTPELKFGVTVSKKHFRKATDRNRIKRIIREVYRVRKLQLLQKMSEKNIQLSLFVIFTGREIPDFAWVEKQFALILERLIHIADENYPTHS